MLHLDPALPALWRTPSVLQFGRAGVLQLEEPALWQLRLIRELSTGVPEIGVSALARSLGAPPAEVGPFLERLRPVLVPARRQLRVLIECAEDPAARLAAAVAGALCDLGLEATSAAASDIRSAGDHPDAVILLAAHALHPRRAAAWMREDVPHLPLVLGSGSAEVGPLIVPGASPCLGCIAAYERERDPAWPALTAQLIGRAEPVGPSALALEAALHAGRLITAVRVAESLRLDATADAVRQRWVRHPECSCGSLEESETVPARAFPATTTSPATAVPA